MRPRCSSAAGIVSAIRALGRSRTGHPGSASVTATDCGRINAAGLEMSKGKAPKMIGALCEARAARASAIRGKAVCTPSAAMTPSGPVRTNVGSRVTPVRPGWGGPSAPTR